VERILWSEVTGTILSESLENIRARFGVLLTVHISIFIVLLTVHLSIFIVLLTVHLSIFIVLLTVHFSIFFVLLTVHLSIFISVFNQLDAQNCFTVIFISCL
jgi:hypothetical protein